jgi:hypothetical protein
MDPKSSQVNGGPTPLQRVSLLQVIISLLLAVPAAIVSFGGEGPSGSMFLSPQAAYAEQNWKNEFDEICAKNDEAMSLGVDELKNLIQRCDKLKPRIEALDESPRKVYLRRLQLCRDLYLFVLESKEQEKLQPSAAAPGQK